jgi:hypothetical protein
LSAARAGAQATTETVAAIANIHRLFIDLPRAGVLEKRGIVRRKHAPTMSIALFKSNVYNTRRANAVLTARLMLLYYASNPGCSQLA